MMMAMDNDDHCNDDDGGLDGACDDYDGDDHDGGDDDGDDDDGDDHGDDSNNGLFHHNVLNDITPFTFTCTDMSRVQCCSSIHADQSCLVLCINKDP
jgi:hypothetical protein